MSALTLPSHATEIVDYGSAVTGTVTSGQYNLPVVGACVYPVVEGVLASEESLAGDYYVHQTFAGACTNADGNFSVVPPAALTKSMPAAQLYIVPSNSLSAGMEIPATSSSAVSLATANGRVLGYVTQGGKPVANFLVEVQDPNHKVIGVAFTDATGLYEAGIAADSALEVTVTPVGLLGENYSADVVGALSQDLAAGKGVDAVANEMQLPDSATLTGSVAVQGTSAHPWQVVHADCKANCTSGLVGLTDDTGKFTFVVPAGASMILGYGGTLYDHQFESGSIVLPPAVTVPQGGSEITYGATPTTWFASQSLISYSKSNTWQWSGGTLESSPYAFQRREAVATYASGLSPYTDPVTAYSGTLTRDVLAGHSECVRVITVTALSGLGAGTTGTPAVQCVTVPLDERSLRASSGWHKYTAASAYLRTLLTARTTGQTLTLHGATGHRIAVIFGRTPVGGAFKIAVNGKTVLTVGTSGKASNRNVALTSIRAFAHATLTLTTTNARAVSIDGVAVLP